MRVILAGLAALILTACNPMEVMDETEGAIAQFHDDWNAGNADAIWATTHREFREGPSQEEFRAAMAGFAQVLGDVESSERQGFDINTSNGVTTTVITMNTQFANGEGIEQFTYRDQGETQRLVYYYVESDLLNGIKPGEVAGADYYSPEETEAEAEPRPAD